MHFQIRRRKHYKWHLSLSFSSFQQQQNLHPPLPAPSSRYLFSSIVAILLIFLLLLGNQVHLSRHGLFSAPAPIFQFQHHVDTYLFTLFSLPFFSLYSVSCISRSKFHVTGTGQAHLDSGFIYVLPCNMLVISDYEFPLDELNNHNPMG